MISLSNYIFTGSEIFANFLSDLFLRPIPIFGFGFIPLVVLFILVSSIVFGGLLRFMPILWLFESIYWFIFSKKSKEEESTKKIIMFGIGSALDMGSIMSVALFVGKYGPGVVFWLVIAAIISSPLRFLEVFAGMIFRDKHSDGEFRGGPQTYIKKIFAILNMKKLGLVFSAIFSFTIIFSTFISPQINQISEVLSYDPFPIKREISTILVASMCAWISYMNSNSIFRVVSVIVVYMNISYFIFSGLIILANYNSIIPSIILICKSAFNPYCGIAAISILGFTFQRAFFLNEVGFGSASISHASSKSQNPFTEAKRSTISSFTSTMFVAVFCGFMCVVSGSYLNSSSGFESMIESSKSIHSGISFFPKMFLPAFGISTSLAWAFYGQSAWIKVFGLNSKIIYVFLYFVFYCLCGMVNSFESILMIADSCNLIIAVPNIISLAFGFKYLKKNILKYSSSK